ncbi:MAG TPA: type II secretion system protein [Pyrinomonadaceae bacterium]|nr:type II secretion system protein [Pyrinomonadaceae bacterium]
MDLKGRDKDAAVQRRGDTAMGLKLACRRAVLSPNRPQDGFSLIELVITMTVMTILTMGVIPLVKVAVKRQKEQQLRESLRQMREAIDQFHREAVRSPCTGLTAGTGGQPGGTATPPLPGTQVAIDPRVKVVISDCTIFGVDNPDRYPPDLQTLVDGVNVIPFGGGLGQRGNLAVNATDAARSDTLATKKKIYLRAIPIDPMTGDKDWDFRSCYDASDAGSWGGENVFDVRSKSKDTALNGEKYSDW